jgi:hypothetical protein
MADACLRIIDYSFSSSRTCSMRWRSERPPHSYPTR